MEITAKLECFKVRAEWMPQMLTNIYETKKARVALLLHQYHIQGEGFWLQIVIGDTPGSITVNPNHNGHWCNGTYISSLRKRNSTVQHQLGKKKKSLFTVFWDEKGVILVNFMCRVPTVISDCYTDTPNRMNVCLHHVHPKRTMKCHSSMTVLGCAQVCGQHEPWQILNRECSHLYPTVLTSVHQIITSLVH